MQTDASPLTFRRGSFSSAVKARRAYSSSILYILVVAVEEGVLRQLQLQNAKQRVYFVLGLLCKVEERQY